VVRKQFIGGHPSPFKRFARCGAGALALLLATTANSQSTPVPAILAPSIVRATPAIWEIRDSDTTIYLFGTFHTLDERTVWFDNQVRQAFDGSDELVLETVVPSTREAVEAAARSQVTQSLADGSRKLRPFMAETQQAVSQGREIGLSVDNGADTVLRRIAEGEGKQVGGLERFEDQLGQLARIPAQPATRATTEPVAVTLNQLLGAWARGDTGTFSTMLAGFEAKAPAAYRMLIADRNARWGQWIVNRLDQPGTVFVAVGSGHLAGKDSVQSWLATRGITATRIG
jgi:uncharacterized protein YbaP (TraB family)